MNFKTILPIAFLVAAAGSALVTTNTGCDQQAPKCSSARGDYIVRYTYVSGPKDKCTAKGDRVGFQTYNAIGENGKPDLNRASIAIQAETLGDLSANADTGGVDDTDPQDKQYSLGYFNTAEPVGDVCTVPTLSIAQQQLGAVTANKDAGVTDQAATLVNFEWKNVQIYVTTQYYGSQFIADVVIGTDGTDCGYKAQGLYPYVDCTKLGADGKPEKGADGKPTGAADESFCNPDPNPPAHPTGSGINPDFAVHCDPDLLVCVTNSTAFPAFR